MQSCEQVTHSQLSPFHQPQIPVVHHVPRLYSQIQVGRKEGKGTVQSYLFQVKKLKGIFKMEINSSRRKEDSACTNKHIFLQVYGMVEEPVWSYCKASLVPGITYQLFLCFT